MKCNSKIFLSVFLISIAGTGTIDATEISTINQNVTSFPTAVAKLIEDNIQRYSNLKNSMKKSGINSENTNLRQQEAQITVALNEASDIYMKITRIVTESCSYIMAIHSESEDLPKLSDVSPEKFSKTSKLVIKDQAFSLKSMIKTITQKATTAHGFMDEITKKLTKVLDVIGDIKESLHLLKTERIKSLGDEPSLKDRDDVVFDEILENIIKFIKHSKDYVDWLKVSISNLKSSIGTNLKIISKLRETVVAGEDLVKNLPLSNEELDKLSKDQIISTSDKIKSVVQDTIDICNGVNRG